jgi:hypothetical protein
MTTHHGPKHLRILSNMPLLVWEGSEMQLRGWRMAQTFLRPPWPSRDLINWHPCRRTPGNTRYLKILPQLPVSPRDNPPALSSFDMIITSLLDRLGLIHAPRVPGRGLGLDRHPDRGVG